MKKCFLVIFIICPVILFAQTENPFTDVVKVSVSPVKNQQKTGTCWSFATTSFLEAELLRMGKGTFDLSEMYFVREAYIDKAKMFLKYHGKTNFSQGGQAHDVMNVLKETGMVPESDYKGNVYDPETHNHKDLVEDLRKFMARTNKNFNEKKLESWEQEYSKILDSYLGAVPSYFNVKGQSYDPQSLVEFLQINPDNYIEFTSYSCYPFYEKVLLEIPDNWSNDFYYNVPIEDLMAIINSSFENGYTVCWDGDTSEKGFKHKKGVAGLKDIYEVTDELRLETFNNRKTTDDHLMHIAGIAENEKGEKYYYTKNSWGTEKNEYGGYLYMSEPYVKLKTVAILVHKDAVPVSIREKIKL